MALIKHMIGEMSGKIGGAVFGHNRGGSFVRKWKKPTNPNSSYQQKVRTAVANLVDYWTETLDAVERALWETYAKNVATTNRLGETIYLTGQQQFVRANSPRVGRGLAVVDTAPTTFNLCELGPVSVTIVKTNEVTVAFDDTQDWCTEPGAALLMYQGRPQNPSINFFKGPFTTTGGPVGSAGDPPKTGLEQNMKYKMANGQKGFFRIRLTRADGRLSATQIVSAIAVIA